MRASRLVNALLLLQTRGRMTAAELAAALEVSERTVHRDLAALAEAGVPVYSEPGPGGGARLVDGYRTRLNGLSAAEASSLFLTGLGDAAAQLGLGTVVAAAQLKVLAALPPGLRTRAGRVRERFHLDAPGWHRGEEEVPALERVADAVWAERRLRMRYRGRRHLVQRTVDPLGLVLKAGRWYLVATHRGQLRTFRVVRIERPDLLAAAAVRPAGFDLAVAWREASAAFDVHLHRYPVEARMSPEGLAGFRRLVAPAAARAVDAGPAGPDGWAPVSFLTESEEVAASELLRFAGDVEVLAPPALRARMAAAGASLAARYGVSGPVPSSAPDAWGGA
jgi:predicted DNA-binding transcriptional regulator YafY